MHHPIYVLILAGGSGERFWPYSRAARPKQLLQLFSDTTLLEDTVERLDGLVPNENILILTNTVQEDAVRAVCPQLPEENIIAEPAKRDTAAAIGLGAAWISRQDPTAIMIVLPADHLIKDRASFQNDLRAACLAAEQTGDLITIGIRPTWACPSFGYIEMDAAVQIAEVDRPVFHEVKRFREKPNRELAESFLGSGNFRWNAGMFIWSVNTILTELTRHVPEIGHFVSQMHETNDFSATLKKLFPTLPKVSVDYAIMEKASRVLMAEASFDWDDVGTWAAVAKYFPSDAEDNISNGPLISEDARQNIVFTSSKKQVALLGVSDLIVIETEDALLVCNRNDAEKIKSIVNQIPKELQ